MTYVIATTETQSRFYLFVDGGKPELSPVLDRKKVSLFATKQDAKEAAVAAGLKVWRYMRL